MTSTAQSPVTAQPVLTQKAPLPWLAPTKLQAPVTSHQQLPVLNPSTNATSSLNINWSLDIDQIVGPTQSASVGSSSRQAEASSQQAAAPRQGSSARPTTTPKPQPKQSCIAIELDGMTRSVVANLDSPLKQAISLCGGQTRETRLSLWVRMDLGPLLRRSRPKKPINGRPPLMKRSLN